MPVKIEELIEAITILAANENIRVTVKSSLKASCTTAVATFAGGMLLGRAGIPIGAAIGGLFAYSRTKEDFKSVADIIQYELTSEEKKKLCQHLVDAFKEVQAEEIAMLIITQPGQLQTLAIKKIIQFFVEEMKMEILK